jgi:hypothetical protein
MEKEKGQTEREKPSTAHVCFAKIFFHFFLYLSLKQNFPNCIIILGAVQVLRNGIILE